MISVHQSSLLVADVCRRTAEQGGEVEDLAAHAAAAGLPLEGGWSARRRLRTVGVRAGTYDIYYVAPDGEVGRAEAAIEICHPHLALVHTE